MNISINESILDKYNLSIEEFLMLYLSAQDISIEEVINSLIDKGFVDRDLYSNVKAVVSNNTKDIISSILIDSDKCVINKDKEFIDLAEKMRNLYPKGRKPGTTYLWCDATPIIAQKLKTVVTKYKFSFTEEEAINATKIYLNQHNNGDEDMRLLKYFILKTDKTTGDVYSDFMTIIQNNRIQKIDISDENWLNEVR